MPEVGVKLLPKEELENKTLELRNPEPSDATKKKGYWIQGILKNCTQFDLQVRPPPYFNSGRYETGPLDIPAWSVGQFTAVNGDWNLEGATGGNAWDLILEVGVELNLALGFTCPTVGAYKSAVIESVTAKDGYDRARKGGNKIISKDVFSGVDTDGNDMSIVFEAHSSGKQRPIYTITQKVH
ncbi:hypothetical protein NW762_013867 [Fusarium torreyae]|uniref:Uncharacterized protein n=1 Tax=Fusarium torreyae TaxID=1237075 RepID=A0A9W8RMI9_9HYPO|nr:hypothetical protein NW762_013867 [Fusarium torreyae]